MGHDDEPREPAPAAVAVEDAWKPTKYYRSNGRRRRAAAGVIEQNALNVRNWTSDEGIPSEARDPELVRTGFLGLRPSE